MFTGIIEETGTIIGMERQVDSIRLTVRADKVLENTMIGDSIAVNGVCLTVTSMTDSSFCADVMHETMRRSSFKDIRNGSTVNLERAVAVGGRLGGHIVSGHIDGTGTVSRIVRDGIAHIYHITASNDLLRFIVEKGSVCIDGVSLTVVSVTDTEFSVSLIPHTSGHTTLSEKKAGAVVNLETDVIAKYIMKLTVPYEKKGSSLSLQTLLENGF